MIPFQGMPFSRSGLSLAMRQVMNVPSGRFRGQPCPARGQLRYVSTGSQEYCLVRGCHRDPAGAEMLRGLVRAATTYGGRVVAEGIETREEYRAALAVGLAYGQGFLFGRPLAPEEWRKPGAVLRGDIPVVRASSPHRQLRIVQ